jgi:hypothetical protein
MPSDDSDPEYGLQTFGLSHFEAIFYWCGLKYFLEDCFIKVVHICAGAYM